MSTQVVVSSEPSLPRLLSIADVAERLGNREKKYDAARRLLQQFHKATGLVLNLGTKTRKALALRAEDWPGFLEWLRTRNK